MIINNNLINYSTYKRLKYIIYIYLDNHKKNDYLNEFNFNRVKTSNGDWFRIEPNGIHNADSTITVETTLNFNSVASSFVGYLLGVPNLRLFYYDGELFTNNGMVEIKNNKMILLLDYIDKNGYKIINYFKQAFDKDTSAKFNIMLSSSISPIKNDIYVPPTRETNTVNIDEFKDDIELLKNTIINLNNKIKDLSTTNIILNNKCRELECRISRIEHELSK